MEREYEEESLTQEEWELDETVRRWFRRGTAPPWGRVSFGELWEGLAAPGALETLAAYPEHWLGVSDFFLSDFLITGRLQFEAYLPYLKFLVDNRERIPRKELALLWVSYLWSRSSWLYLDGLSHESIWVETPDGAIEVCRRRDAYLRLVNLRAKGSDRVATTEPTTERLRNSLVTDPLFVDDPECCYRYCVLQKLGWEMLRYTIGRRHVKARMTAPMRAALKEDDAAAFAISLDLSGIGVSYSLIWEVVTASAMKILRNLFESGRIPEAVLTLPELCCLLVAKFPEFPDNKAIKILGAIEEWHPGTIGGVRDAFGRNLLWYTIHNPTTLWFADDIGIPEFLMTHGCSPENANQVGLTWRELCEALTPEQKERYIYYKNLGPNGYADSFWWAWWKKRGEKNGHSRWQAPTPVVK